MAEISLQLNGNQRTFSVASLTISDLFDQIGMTPDHKIVELNGEIISKEQYADLQLSHDDVLEIIQFMGGGAA